MKRFLPKCLVPLLFCLASPIFAQPTWDASGNRLLSGVYNFREVIWLIGTGASGSGNLTRAIAQWGTINFNGNGGYTLTATVRDSNLTNTDTYTLNGTYSIAANGYGFLTQPLSTGGGERLFGLVSQGVFIGSTTEKSDATSLGFAQLHDLFIAAPAGSPPATNASLNGSFWVAEVNFPSLTTAQVRDSMYQATFNGQGGISAINAAGFLGTNTNRQTQSIGSATYSFANGIGTIAYGGTLTGTTLLAGNKTVYSAADGNFFFGGSQTGWDMVVGIKAASGGASNLLSGLYYQAGADVQRAEGSNPAILTSYYGAFKAVDRGGINGHQRLALADARTYDFTYTDVVNVAADGKHEDFLGFTQAIGANGNFRVGIGEVGLVGLNVAVKGPTFTGQGVFLDPTGVVNGASFTPFTVGTSPGAVMTLFGTGLASATLGDGTFPTTLGGVRVMVNGRAAPVFAVSPGQVSFVTPWGTTEAIAEITVVNNGVSSNKVTIWVNETTPGIFSQSQSGSGFAAALHANFNVVNPQNQARPGEVILLYLTGLGEVDPAVADGVPGPTNPLSVVKAGLDVIMGGTRATIEYKGLAPGWPGLYQINFKVPEGIESGNRFVNISGPDSFTSMVAIPIAGGTVSDSLDPRSKENVRSLGRLRSLRPDRAAEQTARPTRSRRN